MSPPKDRGRRSDNMEKKIIVAYRNITATGERASDFTKRAKGITPDNPERVYLRKSDGENFSIHFEKDCSDNPPILKVAGKDQTADNSSKYGELFGTFASSSSEVGELVSKKHIAHIISAVGPTKFLVSIEEADSGTVVEVPSASEIETLENKLVELEIWTPDTLSRRKIYLEKIGVDLGSNLYKKYIKKRLKRGKKGEEISEPAVVYEPTNMDDKTIFDMLVHILNGNNTILEGPKSTGKNVAWETVAWLLDCEIVMLQCDGAMTKSQMLGYQSTDNSSKEKISEEAIEEAISEGKKIFSTARKKIVALIKAILWSLSPTLSMVFGPVSEALRKAKDGEGVILILDEMNLSDPNTLSGCINSIADGHTPWYFITGWGKMPIIRENLILGATQNGCTGDYLGTQSQNDATMSRFVCITLTPPENINKILSKAVPTADIDDVEVFGKVYKKFYELYTSDLVGESCLNIRGFISALRVREDKMTVYSAIEQAVVNTVSNMDDRELLSQAIEQAMDDF